MMIFVVDLYLYFTPKGVWRYLAKILLPIKIKYPRLSIRRFVLWYSQGCNCQLPTPKLRPQVFAPFGIGIQDIVVFRRKPAEAIIHRSVHPVFHQS